MRSFSVLVIVMLMYGAMAHAVESGVGTVTLVDGTETSCEVLFEHPHAPRLIVRSPAYRTVQSLDLEQVHAVTVNARTTTYADRRELSEAEQLARERNGLWGDEAGEGQIGRYAQEPWDPRPLLVWARPGESGNALDPANWLDEHGQPLSELPWREVREGGRRGVAHVFDGDVLLPAAEQPYEAIQPGKRDGSAGYAIRHLTVEAHGHYRLRYTVRGNLWVKDGASLGGGTQTGGLGGGDTHKHTFARFGNYHDGPEPTWAYAPSISHWVWIDTGERGSLELIGCSGGAGDRTTVNRGTFVVSEDSFIGNGRRGAFYTQPDTTVVMLDGARIGCPDPLKTVGTYAIAGTLMFGTPEHPLTRDLPFGGCYYFKDRLTPDASPNQRSNAASFVLGPTGRMVVHSADSQKARVRFQPRSRNLPVSRYAMGGKENHHFEVRHGHTYMAPEAELWEQPGVPTGVTAVFRGETDFNGVVFDGFYEGGIMVSRDAARRWRNVEFGENNHGQGEALFQFLEE